MEGSSEVGEDIVGCCLAAFGPAQRMESNAGAELRKIFILHSQTTTPIAYNHGRMVFSPDKETTPRTLGKENLVSPQNKVYDLSLPSSSTSTSSSGYLLRGVSLDCSPGEKYQYSSSESGIRGDVLKSTPALMFLARSGRAASRRACSEGWRAPMGWMVSTPLGLIRYDQILYYAWQKEWEYLHRG